MSFKQSLKLKSELPQIIMFEHLEIMEEWQPLVQNEVLRRTFFDSPKATTPACVVC